MSNLRFRRKSEKLKTNTDGSQLTKFGKRAQKIKNIEQQLY